MALYFIFTVDGDWDEYFSTELSRARRMPDKRTLLNLVRHEIRIAKLIRGKILHFIHTSPVTRTFFVKPDFVTLWKAIEQGGGSVGVHCHEEGLFSQGELTEPAMLERSVRFLTEPLRENGLKLISYRGGYMTFCEKIIPILERNGLPLDFSCAPGRYLHHKGRLISDWRGAPKNYYRMSYSDHRKEGESDVVTIPLGKLKRRELYIDLTALIDLWQVARIMARKNREAQENTIVSLLTHTYEFSSLWKRVRIRLGLIICRMHGTFINDREALEIITNEKGRGAT